jgi:hypothetical protein
MAGRYRFERTRQLSRVHKTKEDGNIQFPLQTHENVVGHPAQQAQQPRKSIARRMGDYQ